MEPQVDVTENTFVFFLGMDPRGHATTNCIAAVGVEVKNTFDQLCESYMQLAFGDWLLGMETVVFIVVLGTETKKNIHVYARGVHVFMLCVES